jgi:hypothetical protein
LYSAYFFEFQGDRPVFYSLWLAAGHLIFPTYWFAVVAQSLITSLLIRWVMMAHGIRRLDSFHCLVCSGLAVATGICWQTGRIMPDAFTAPMALSFYLLFFARGKIGRAREEFTTLILVFCLLVHYSHMAILLAALLCLWAGGAVAGRTLFPRPRWRIVGSVLVAVSLTVFANQSLGLGYLYSKNPYAFLLSRMVRDGSVAAFLDKNCADKKYVFCDDRAYVTRQTVAGFLWGERGPFRSPVGQAGEYRELIIDMFRSDPWGQLGAVIGEFGLQLFKIGSGDSLERLPGDGWEIAKLRASSPGQVIRLERSRQQAGELSRPVFLLNNVYYLSFWLSCNFLIGFFLKRANRRREEIELATTIGLFLLANAFVCGALSVAVDRYQSRVAWLPVFAALLVSARIWEARSGSSSRSARSA